MISLSYILLCGQFLLLLTVVLLQCLEGIHSQNSTTTETPASSSPPPPPPPPPPPGQGATALPSSEQPETVKYVESTNHTEPYEYRPPSPVVLCSYLPEEFIYCQDPVDHAGNHSAHQELGHGCVGWGGQTRKDANYTQVMCTALDEIECAGPREFLRGHVPCINTPCSPSIPLHSSAHEVNLCSNCMDIRAMQRQDTIKAAPAQRHYSSVVLG
ncbi:TM2 domain-containing protein 2 isoform X2 [Dicentrarchus labrax]|uniref:TM2 domain-containing protein 2 isoform X2 n=1 Tax=Dicentrarchus labrax TaxID=13489 RepID=UPI0021F50A35|nr:TM2 domain-containing protein 2 isoform X2 [Dicentrarchus labrax]